jgi:hypothetical protein
MLSRSVLFLSPCSSGCVIRGHGSYTNGVNRNAGKKGKEGRTDWATAVIWSINLTSGSLRSLVPRPVFGVSTALPQLELESRFWTFGFWTSAALVLELELEHCASLPCVPFAPQASRWLDPTAQRRHTNPSESPRQHFLLHRMKGYPYTHADLFLSLSRGIRQRLNNEQRRSWASSVKVMDRGWATSGTSERKYRCGKL